MGTFRLTDKEHLALIAPNDKLLVEDTSVNNETKYTTPGDIDNILDKYTQAEVDAHNWTEADITDLDKYTQAEVDTISESLQNNINTKDNYSSWSFAINSVTKDAITSGDILNFVSGANISIIRSANNEITISGSGSGGGGGGGTTDHSALYNLDYASSGHTGFQPAGEYVTDTELTTVSGDLQTNIDGKSDIGHTHTEADITDLDKYTQAEVDAHNWVEADITDLDKYTQAEVDSHNWVEADITDLDKYTQAEVDTISESLQTNIDGKSDIGHTHTEADITDLDKYTKAEVDAHNWVEADITDLNKYTETEVDTISGSLQTNIDGKSDIGHTHTESDITDLDKYTKAEVDSHNWVEADITDLDKYTKAEVDAHNWVEADITDLDKYTRAQVDEDIANHKWVEADITDLDKYTQAQVDNAIAAKADSGVNADITSMTGLNDGGIPGAKVAVASDTSVGVSKSATKAEALAGTDTSDYITPASLNYVLNPSTCYGVSWDESQDTGGYTRTESLTGKPTGQTLDDSLIPIQAAMRRCVMTDDGVVQYYLDPSDSTKKEDGTTADLTGADGQVMVEIPAFYYRYSYSGTTHTWYISSELLSGFTLHPAFIKNGESVSYRYIGAYEGILYDTSASTYTDGLRLSSHTVSFDSSNNTISTTSYIQPYRRLKAGDKIIIENSNSNNGTFTVTSAGDQSFTVSESLTDEDSTSGVFLKTETDWTESGDVLSSVSGKCPINEGTRASFRIVAKNRGTGWRQQDYDLVSAIQLLYLVEYASWDSQSMISAGFTNFGSDNWTDCNDHNPIANTGLSNSLGNSSGGVDNGSGHPDSYMSYRGIENFFGHIWKWVDGINIDNGVPYVCNDDTKFDDDTSTNYTDLGVTLVGDEGWIKTLTQIAEGFLPASVGGSSSTYVTDYYYRNPDWRSALMGNDLAGGVNGGMACWHFAATSTSISKAIISRLSY